MNNLPVKETWHSYPRHPAKLELREIKQKARQPGEPFSFVLTNLAQPLCFDYFAKGTSCNSFIQIEMHLNPPEGVPTHNPAYQSYPSFVQ